MDNKKDDNKNTKVDSLDVNETKEESKEEIVVESLEDDEPKKEEAPKEKIVVESLEDDEESKEEAPKKEIVVESLEDDEESKEETPKQEIVVESLEDDEESKEETPKQEIVVESLEDDEEKEETPTVKIETESLEEAEEVKEETPKESIEAKTLEADNKETKEEISSESPEEKTEEVEESQKSNEETIVEQTQEEKNEEDTEKEENEEKMKKKEKSKKVKKQILKINNRLLPLIAIVVLVVGCLIFVGTNMLKSKNSSNESDNDEEEAITIERFEGIYKNNEDKLYIHKISDTSFFYVISGIFQGQAILTDKTAKQEGSEKAIYYFEFKPVKNGIELIHHSEDNQITIKVATGKYEKIAEYSKENVYKEAVGDPSYLNSKYSGVFKSGEMVLYLYQKNEKEVKVEASEFISDYDPYFSETFTIESDNKLVAKSSFEEDKIAYEITFNDKQFTFKGNTDVSDYNEEIKSLELTYTFDKEVTQDDILNQFYRNY